MHVTGSFSSHNSVPPGWLWASPENPFLESLRCSLSKFGSALTKPTLWRQRGPSPPAVMRMWRRHRKITNCFDVQQKQFRKIRHKKRPASPHFALVLPLRTGSPPPHTLLAQLNALGPVYVFPLWDFSSVLIEELPRAPFTSRNNGLQFVRFTSKRKQNKKREKKKPTNICKLKLRLWHVVEMQPAAKTNMQSVPSWVLVICVDK